MRSRHITVVVLIALPAILFSPDSGRTQDGGRSSGFFDKVSGGRDEVMISQIQDPKMKAIFSKIAEKIGITSDRVTREQFQAISQKKGGGTGAGGPGFGGQGFGGQGYGGQGFGGQGFGGPGGAGPGAMGPGGRWAGMPGMPGREGSVTPGAEGARPAFRPDEQFNRLDRDRDGLLTYDEMPEELRLERDRWDTNQDGFISLEEFTAFAKVSMEFRPDARPGEFNPAGPAPEDQQQDRQRRPTVYRTGNLPKELPPWFASLDTDGDAQIGLYEWRAAKRPIAEFLVMDRNDDGLVTVDEALRSVKGFTPKMPGGDQFARAGGQQRGNFGPGEGREMRPGSGQGFPGGFPQRGEGAAGARPQGPGGMWQGGGGQGGGQRNRGPGGGPPGGGGFQGRPPGGTTPSAATPGSATPGSATPAAAPQAGPPQGRGPGQQGGDNQRRGPGGGQGKNKGR
jgi:hypothetical protein